MNNTLSFHESSYMTFQKLTEGIYTLIKNREGRQGGFFTNEDVVVNLNTTNRVCIVDDRMRLITSNFKLDGVNEMILDNWEREFKNSK